MTIQMIITLAIVIGMIVMIMSDKFAFGAPPLIACVLLVLTGCATMSEAFAGFVDKNVIMIAGFMVVMAALEKTSLIDKVKATMFNMASKGGYRNYILLLIVVMLGASVMSGTGYYVLVLSLVSTIPYNKNLPISKIFMPLGYATYNPIVPVNMAFYVGLVASLLESSGVTGTAVPLLVYSGIKLVSSIAFLVWAVIGYRFLPDHPIAEAGAQASEQKSEGEKLSRWKEIVVYIAFVVNFVAMIFLDKLGEPGYAIPGVIAAVLFVLGILNFKEVRNNIASPLILMMAGVIGVAGALANSGFTAMVGDAVAGALGTSVSPFVIVLVFTLLTSLSATFTALEKTSLIDKVKATMFNMASKGGYRNYILLLIVVMLGASVMSGTGYYVLVLSLVSTIPYNKNLPISKIFMPLGYATYNPIVPVNMAFYVGLVASLLESSGVTGTAVPLLVYSGIKLVSSIAFLVWAVIGYRFLPDHPIAEAGAQASEQKSEGEKLSRWKEIVVYIAFVVNFVAMIFLDKLGEPGYAIPGVIAAVLFVLGILNFKEVRNNIASPLILMMAGVIGVAGALANSGFTAMVGDAVAGALGTSVSPFVIVLVFTLLTSLSATFTGASFGSLFVFAPIAISACVSMGLDPTAVAVACVTAAWINWIMPIDGMPAMILGMGKYKLVDFWKFTLPLYVIQILVLCGACVIVFPM